MFLGDTSIISCTTFASEVKKVYVCMCMSINFPLSDLTELLILATHHVLASNGAFCSASKFK